MYIYIDRLLQELKRTDRATIKELSDLCVMDRKLVADILLTMHQHLKNVKAFSRGQSKELTKIELACYASNYQMIDFEVDWRLQRNTQKVFSNLTEREIQLLVELLTMIGHSDIICQYPELSDQQVDYPLIHTNIGRNEKNKVIELIGEAIKQNQAIKVNYLGMSQRIIPYHLHYDGNNQYNYLIGHKLMHERSGLFHFRCSRMEDIEKLDKRVTLHYSRVNIFQYISKYFYQDTSQMENVEILVYKQGTNTIRETIRRYGRFCTITYDEHQNMLLKGTIYGIHTFARYLRSMGSGVKVIGPIALIEEMVQSCHRKLAAYKEYEIK